MAKLIRSPLGFPTLCRTCIPYVSVLKLLVSGVFLRGEVCLWVTILLSFQISVQNAHLEFEENCFLADDALRAKGTREYALMDNYTLPIPY